MSDKPNPLQNVTMNVAALLFECRIAAAAVHAGVEMLARRSTEPPIAAELRALEKLSNQGCEALELLQAALVDGLTLEEQSAL
jgi:hypothetical protein